MTEQTEYPVEFSTRFNGVFHDKERSHLGTFGQGYGPKSEYRGLTLKGERVLDLGAHTGGLTCWALDEGASATMSVEAAADNFWYLSKNVDFRRPKTEAEITVINKAVTGAKDFKTEMEFWLTPNHDMKGHGQGSLVPRRGRYCVKVPTVKVGELFEEFKPTVLKLDIEGGEYTMMEELENIPASVLQLGLEVHFCASYPKKWIHEVFMPMIYNQGFKVTSGDKFMMANNVLNSNRFGCSSGTFLR